MPSTTRAAPRIEPERDRLRAADAAAQLHPHVRGGEDRVHRGLIARGAGESAVEIDDVEPTRAGGGETPRLRRRIVVEHGRRAHLAAHQADAAPVLQIDGGEKDHGRHPRKFASTARPVAWLFSGWNCTPARLSRADRRRQRAAIVDRRHHVGGVLGE